MRALFYVEALPGVGDVVVVDGEEGHHAANVRRIRPGEELDLSDGAGTLAHCVVEETAKGRLTARVVAVRVVPLPAPRVTVVQALPKSERSELAVELATEAGADEIVAWQAARCVARWEGTARVGKGLHRWRSVARSAARQSRRARVPTVAAAMSTLEVAELIGGVTASGGHGLVLHESASEPLAGVPLRDATALVLVVGPEGGIDDSEVADLRAAGARAVRLGPTVLRTSTAAAVALGALGVLTPRWDVP